MSKHSQALLLGAALASSVAMYGCGDTSNDGDAGEHDGEHVADHMMDHEHGTGGCGDTANCKDTLDLEAASLPLTIEGEDGNFNVMLHMFSSPLKPSPNDWMVMLMNEDGPVADGELSVSTWSVDCMHPGASEEMVTTDDQGMATVHPETLHGGPWEVIFEVSANGKTDTITFNLCIDAPGHDETLGADDAGT